MKLSGKEIEKRVNSGEIVIEPFDRKNLGPNSYDLQLAPELLVYKHNPGVRGTTSKVPYTRDIERMRLLSVDMGIAIEAAEWTDVLDMAKESPYYRLTIPAEGLVLVPGRLYIGSTVEYTETHGLVPCIEGRSSIGRLGINIHSTAGFGDIGFCGTWTLEISVVEPVRVYAGVRFCQIHYEPVLGEFDTYLSDKYQGQRGPRPSGIWREFQNKDNPT